METHPGEEVVKEEKFPNTRKPSHQWVCGEFWNLRGQHNQELKKKKNPQIMRLAATPSGEVAQTLISVSSKRAEQGGMGCMHRVGTGPKCPEDNMTELT